MKNPLPVALCTLFLSLAAGCPAFAQDSEQPGDEDGSSEQVESSDDAYRRRMELEDARRQDPSYTDPIDSYKKELEKIDKLPEESRENVRDQLVDVIVKNGEWEPSDALEEYPYEPTEAAKGDPVLMEQEQEAWEEQIEKYHEREAAAFGAYRGPVPGPGNPTGQQGGQPGSPGAQPGQQGQGNGQGGQGSGQSGAGSPGTYEYQSNRSGTEDEVSTDGVSESALDFLKGRQGQGSASGQQASSESQQGQSGEAPASAASQSTADEAPSTDGALQSAAQWAAQQAESEQNEQSSESGQDPSESPAQSSEQPSEEQQQQASSEPEQELRGIIAIEDLDKLEGAVAPEEDEAGSDNER